MRNVWIVSVLGLVLSLAGCGSKGSTRRAEPASLTPDQVEADVNNQKTAAAAEGQRQASLAKSANGQSAAEDAERRRGR